MEPLKADSFEAIKQIAYKAAVEGVKQSFSRKWEQTFLERYHPSSIVFIYQELTEIYGEFLTNKITKDEGMVKISALEQKYEEINNTLSQFLKISQAVQKAFKEQNIEFGRVSFDCPICKGSFTAEKLNTPKFHHKVTIRGGCKSCGYSYMN